MEISLCNGAICDILLSHEERIRDHEVTPDETGRSSLDESLLVAVIETSKEGVFFYQRQKKEEEI